VKLLVVNWQDRENPQAGGAEVHLHEVFGRIAARGHQVDLLCSGFPGSESETVLDGIRVFRVGTRYTFPMYARACYEEGLARNGYDVVIEDLNKVPLYTPRWRVQRLVVLVHHLFGATAFREAPIPVAAAVWLSERPLASLYGGHPFQAVSQSTADDLADRGIPRSMIRVIYNGVDAGHYTPDWSRRAADPTFAYLGRLKRYKRVDIVLRAFAQLNAADAKLEIAGQGDHRPALESLGRSLGLGDRLRFLGYVDEDEKVDLLRRAWATVLASPKEGWGISNLESAACGTPVIAGDSPGIRESVIDGETGFLVPATDVSAFAAAMRGLVAQPDLVRSLGEGGRRFAEQFTWERAADETLRHLEEVIAA
jgi:glycosyltransferase involved in cell wall biosynthesis